MLGEEEIRADLLAIRRRRRLVVLGYAGLVALLIGGLATAPGPIDVQRDATWMAALFLLFVGSTAATAVAVGVPLFRRTTTYVVTGVIGVALLAGLVLAAMPGVAAGAGPKCFVFGSIVSTVAMVLLGALSGRHWRRFPNPAFLLAVGVTGVGLAALHLRCPSTEAAHLFGFHLTPILLLYALTRVAVYVREDMLALGEDRPPVA